MTEKKQTKPKFKLWGNPILSTQTDLVTKEYLKGPEFKETVKKLFEITEENGAVGLAANQIGINKSFALVRVKPTPTRPDLPLVPPTLIINPQIIEYSKSLQYEWEGCFSNLDIFFYIPRSKWIKVKYMNEEGKVVTRKIEGFEAIVFQHEIDHLDGVICGERVLIVDGKVAKGAIITRDERAKNPKQIPVGARHLIK